MKLEELVNMCSVGQLFSIRNYSNGAFLTAYRGQSGIDDLICQYNVRLITIQDDFMVVFVDVE